MSHLNHILEFKTKLEKDGVTCLKAQKTYINQLIIQAITSYIVKGRLNPQQMENYIYKMLDKWNCVYPIDGMYIKLAAYKAVNDAKEQLVNNGAIYRKADEAIDVSACEVTARLFKSLCAELIEYEEKLNA